MMRKLTASEVTFTVRIEANETPIRGNFMATDDPEQDSADESALLARLERGEVEAWCGVVVEASWESEDGTEYTGHDSIWGCSLDDSYTAAVVAEEHGMRDGALDDLNARLESICASTERLAAELSEASEQACTCDQCPDGAIARGSVE